MRKVGGAVITLKNLRHTDVRGGQKPAETQGTTEESIIQELCITADKWFGSGESFFQRSQIFIAEGRNRGW
jgi:hypothetical protein